MLKYAIIRINESNNDVEILIDYDLGPELEAAVLRTASWHNRKRTVKRVVTAYQSLVDSIKNETMKLP